MGAHFILSIAVENLVTKGSVNDYTFLKDVEILLLRKWLNVAVNNSVACYSRIPLMYKQITIYLSLVTRKKKKRTTKRFVLNTELFCQLTQMFIARANSELFALLRLLLFV